MRREERDALRDRENQRLDVDIPARRKKKPKKGKVKSLHEKSMKQVRRENRAARKSHATSSTCIEEGCVGERDCDGWEAEGEKWGEGVEL